MLSPEVDGPMGVELWLDGGRVVQDLGSYLVAFGYRTVLVRVLYFHWKWGGLMGRDVWPDGNWWFDGSGCLGGWWLPNGVWVPGGVGLDFLLTLKCGG